MKSKILKHVIYELFDNIYNNAKQQASIQVRNVGMMSVQYQTL